MIRGGAAGALLAQALLTAPALGAELAVSRDVEIYGDDVTGQLAPPVADMEAELARRGGRAVSPACWTHTPPRPPLPVAGGCKEGNDADPVSLPADCNSLPSARSPAPARAWQRRPATRARWEGCGGRSRAGPSPRGRGSRPRTRANARRAPATGGSARS